MSKPCEGTKVMPMPGSLLMKNTASPPPPAPTANRYIPPSKRTATEVEHTQINIDTQSETLFPSLAEMKASSRPIKSAWGNPKTANATPLNFKATVERQIENENKEKQGRLIEQEQNKFEGGEEAWITLSLKAKSHNIVNRHIFENEDYWDAKTKWTFLGFRNSLEEIDRNLKEIRCVWLGGEEVERTPPSEADWFSVRNTQNSNALYHENKENSRHKLLAFIGRNTGVYLT